MSRRRSFEEILRIVREPNIRSLMSRATLANRIAKLSTLTAKARRAVYEEKGRILSALYGLVDDIRINVDSRYRGKRVLTFKSPKYGFGIHILPRQLSPVNRKKAA